MADKGNNFNEAPELPDNTDFLFASEEPLAPEVVQEAEAGSPEPSKAVEKPVVEDPNAPIVLSREEWEERQRHEAGLRSEMIRQRQSARSEAQARLELQAQWSKGQERLNKMAEAWEKQNAPRPPDPSEDPVGALNLKIESEFERFRRDLAEKEQAQIFHQQQEYQRQQFVGAVTNGEQQFAAQNPDYFDAVAHLRWQRGEELVALGYSPDEILSIVGQESAQFAVQAANRGQNPAEAAYVAAKMRGFAPQNVTGAPQSPQNGQGQGYVPPPSPQNQKMRTIQAGAASGRSLSQTSGSGGGRGITLQDLATMDDATFDIISENPALWEKINQGETVYL